MDIFAQQTEIKQTTRAMAAEWLFRCLKTTQSVRNTETFFLCMSVLDRYIAQVTIPIRQFLLAACASALLASKCEETCGIYPNTLVRNTQNSFSANDLLEAEKRIALQLDMKVQVCSSYQVASALLSEQDPPPSQKQRIIVYYILTLVTTFTHFGEYPQRYLAAAAVHISRVVCNVRSCPPSAEVAQVLPVVLNCVRQGYHGAKIGGLLYDMFAADSYQCVSTIPYESYF
ncbi:hypothetical protein AGDE_08490 [Angomonas deanei]|nr:hypothetical protein AGDE_08490 [Angomonas deanei]|eukprot:EPY32829.1 hypothetical protein AGDE_08490 [Angomonas deanei]